MFWTIQQSNCNPISEDFGTSGRMFESKSKDFSSDIENSEI